MEIKIWQTSDSGAFRVGDSSTEFIDKYTATGSNNRFAILAEIINSEDIEEEIGGVPRVDISAEPIDGSDDKWDIEILYSLNPSSTISPQIVGDEVTTFTTGGGSTRLKQALRHVESYAPDGETAPDHGGAINVTDQGIEGVEIIVPAWTMRIEKLFDSVQVTQGFLNGIFEATGGVNNASFRGFNPGELLLARVDGQPASEESYRISYDLIGSANVTDLTVGTITGISKEGHDYLWSEHETKIENEGTSDARAVRKLKAIHIEEVYPRVDLSGLTGLLA